MLKIAFVILNYGTYDETRECVQSIEDHLDVEVENYNITIVDNGSKEESQIKLKKLYNNRSGIDLIENGDNFGFARGNNVGIKHVCKTYDPEFVVVLNSDTELFQDDLYSKLSAEYDHSGFGLLGPMMCIAGGRCDDSPWKPIDIGAIETKLAEYERTRQKILNGTIVLDKVINRIKKGVFGFEWQDTFHKHCDYWKYQTDVELQGAFLVFSKKLLEHIEGFDSRTFLYYEEQLLYLKVKKTGLPIVYDPRICIYHKDGRTTSKLSGATKDKLLFLNQCNIDSLRILRDELIAGETV